MLPQYTVFALKVQNLIKKSGLIRIYEVYDILKYKEEKQESIKKKNSKVCVC
jgi:hypothetical protein